MALSSLPYTASETMLAQGARTAATVVPRAAASISSAIGGEGRLSLADVARKAEDIARDARNLPEEKKASLRQNIGAISRELAPFVDAWRNPPEVPANPPK